MLINFSVCMGLPVASLIDGFLISDFTGQIIVLIQILLSIIGLAIFIGKNKSLGFVEFRTRAFQRDFSAGNDVLDYHFSRPVSSRTPLERIYENTCARILKLLDSDARIACINRTAEKASVALSVREVALVRSTCESTCQDEEIRIEHGMSLLATIVAAAPMLGLLGTVWGVLDAFAMMGNEQTVQIAKLAPAISSALVTTVVGLLVAIPGTLFYNLLDGKIRYITTGMYGFVDELMGRIAMEYQGGRE